MANSKSGQSFGSFLIGEEPFVNVQSKPLSPADLRAPKCNFSMGVIGISYGALREVGLGLCMAAQVGQIFRYNYLILEYNQGVTE